MTLIYNQSFSDWWLMAFVTRCNITIKNYNSNTIIMLVQFKIGTRQKKSDATRRQHKPVFPAPGLHTCTDDIHKWSIWIILTTLNTFPEDSACYVQQKIVKINCSLHELCMYELGGIVFVSLHICFIKFCECWPMYISSMSNWNCSAKFLLTTA